MSSETPTATLIKPRIRGFVCVTSHPEGCQAHVAQQIDYVKGQKPIAVPKNVLVIGSSTGYGLASRIVAAVAGGASTLGVFFEREPSDEKPATAGWYNNRAFEKWAKKEGLYASSINGDAFSYEIMDKAIETIKKDMGRVDLVVFSLASPRRTHPETGVVHNSVLKPIGTSFTNKTLDTDRGIVKDITIEPCNDEDIAETIAVMGGEPWEMWMDRLQAAGALADGATTVAYSYIGPEVTWPVYKEGTIGAAKADLERAAECITAKLSPTGGRAYVSINQAIVTQASSAIPVVPLYISLLFKELKKRGIYEGAIEQIYRLFAEQMFSGKEPELDDRGRLRVDDLEMQDEVQAAVAELWKKVTSENLNELSDFASYRTEFLRLFGFGLPGVDYEKPVNLSEWA
ncbi:MAG: trans-2-enoyl-CoA reductase family protein [Cyanobacteria bacterium HKST-UBA02]|nr:trans-2-enoyl-CoA reductase family protein [Cyanobacteria bacterium HKST-UBA02]